MSESHQENVSELKSAWPQTLAWLDAQVSRRNWIKGVIGLAGAAAVPAIAEVLSAETVLAEPPACRTASSYCTCQTISACACDPTNTYCACCNKICIGCPSPGTCCCWRGSDGSIYCCAQQAARVEVCSNGAVYCSAPFC
jgi:hypothetical protein